eukprot:Skav224642  [mRNA]  locus=scaffold1918:135243:145415:- [translate_table: standard]
MSFSMPSHGDRIRRCEAFLGSRMNIFELRVLRCDTMSTAEINKTVTATWWTFQPKGISLESSCQKSGSKASMAPIGAGTPVKNLDLAIKAPLAPFEEDSVSEALPSVLPSDEALAAASGSSPGGG